VSKFDQIELMFLDLIETSESVLSPSECAEIQEYIDVGEYGLALSTTVAIYFENNKVASADARLLVGRLATAMKMHPDQFLDRLPK
jgi:hypothetical protein